MIEKESIIRFKPFLYRYTSDGLVCTITFTCPKCGGHNCEKAPGEIERDNFWSGHWICTDCGNTKDERGVNICYYSDCFISTKRQEPTEMNLF